MSFKNFFYNISRSVASIVMLTLLSVIIIFFGGIIKTLKSDVEKNLIDMTEKYGMDITMLESNKQDTQEFIELMDKEGLFDTYTFSFILYPGSPGNAAYLDDETSFGLSPVCMGKEKEGGSAELLQGQTWSEDCEGKNYIWITSELSEKTGKSTGDLLKFRYGDTDYEYEIRGIVSGKQACIEYTFFLGRNMAINAVLYQRDLKNVDMQFFERLARIDSYLLDKYDLDNPNAISGMAYNYYVNAVKGEKATIIVAVFLSAVCLGCSIGSILNTIKINIRKNSYAFGMMRALGAKGKDIYWYIVLQWLLIIVVATLIACVIAAILTMTVFDDILLMMLRLIFSDVALVTTPQISYWSILINLAVLVGTIMLSSLFLLKKYTHNPVITVLQGGE